MNETAPPSLLCLMRLQSGECPAGVGSKRLFPKLRVVWTGEAGQRLRISKLLRHQAAPFESNLLLFMQWPKIRFP